MADSSLSRRFLIRIIATGGLLAGGLLIIASISLWSSYKQDRLSSQHALQTSAQLLEQALTRSFEATDVALTALSRRVTALAEQQDAKSPVYIPTDSEFADSISGLLRFAPHIRQLLVVDDHGNVLFDTAHRTLGTLRLTSLDFDKDGPHAVGGGLLLGAPVPGRFLAEPQAQATPPGMSVLPVIFPFRIHNQTTLYAIAALNSGFFRESFDAVVASDRASSADQVIMARYDGMILVQHTAQELLKAPLPPLESDLKRNFPQIRLPAVLADALTSADGGMIASQMPFSAPLIPGAVDGTVHWRVSSRYPVAIMIGSSDQTLRRIWLRGQSDILVGVPLALLVLVVLIWGLVRQVIARSMLQDRVRVLSKAIEQGPTTVIITDAHGRIEYVNQAFKAILGYQNEDVIGQTPAIVKSGLMREDVYDTLWATITEGKVWQGDLLNRTKDGRLLWMTAAVSGVRGEGGDITHFVAVETDITDRRTLDERLAETQRMTEGLLSLPIILYRINSVGVITDAIGEGLSQLDLTASALIGRRYTTIFPDIEHHFSQALAGAIVRTEGPARFGAKSVWLDHVLAPNPRKNNAHYAQLVAASVDDEEGVLGFALDVTARHAAEKALSATIDCLNASNRELEQFAYVASHDLQEPLRIVSSYLSLLKRRYGSKLGDDADTFINYAVDGAHRMQSLILDLLQLSRIGSQGQALEPINLRPVINQAIANLELVIADTGAVVKVGTLPDVMGDKPQLLRLFQNLIGNSLKYRHPDRKPVITIDACQDGGMWHLVLEDNGQGIGETFREKVFMIFQRLHTREQAEGNGIGLAICRKVVERHGGAIWIDGDENLGTRFHITLKRVLHPVLIE
jgi:PAS domain S-box-containing protein